jgi:hypothetical protein
MGRRTTCLDLCAYRVPSSCLFDNCAHAIPGRSLKGCAGWWFVRPDGPQAATCKRGTELKKLQWPMKAQEFKGWPTDGFDSRSRAPFRTRGGKGWAY